MNIYMDVCCLNRPFDDQTQDRIYIESEAVLKILFNCQNGIWSLIGSDIIDFEIRKISDPDKYENVYILSTLTSNKVKYNDEIKRRALQLREYGLGLFDSIHIASAEYAKVNIMLTTDDKLINKAKIIKDISLRIENPVHWLMEVTSNENNF